MRSRARKLNTPTALDEAIEERVDELPYESFSEYVNWLIIYDLSTRKPHHITGEMARLSRAEIDKIHDEVARAFAAGETLGGSWFEARLRDAVEQLARGEDIPAPKAVRKMLDRIRK
jgi:hypothetical protein